MPDITFYFSLVSGALLTISEVMPYITRIQSNGILHSVTNFLTSKAITTSSTPETRPLLPQYDTQVAEQYREISKKLEELKTTRVSINEIDDKRITIVIE
ncbi:MAG: hypothetical protein EBU90_04425 [Proteobacteria bacterium]|nr:hypothetical protein [Pseudomonadota bacterium]NBP15080.1 hypothetical protein [bacterium]